MSIHDKPLSEVTEADVAEAQASARFAAEVDQLEAFLAELMPHYLVVVRDHEAARAHAFEHAKAAAALIDRATAPLLAVVVARLAMHVAELMTDRGEVQS